MSNFHLLKEAISARWAELVQHDLYRAVIPGQTVWEAYLAAFPPGTNPVFRERTEHDCACCRQFVRAVGNVVAIVGGELVSIWDVEVADPAYQAVVDALSELVRGQEVENVFLHGERDAGVDQNYEETETGGARTWQHLHVPIPHRPNRGRTYYMERRRIPEALGEARTTRDVFYRGLTELTADSLDTVLEIIDNNSLYRGAEFRGAVDAFRALKVEFNDLWKNPRAQRLFAWRPVAPAVARLRNTAIGTLLMDLSAGIDLEEAVRKFETSVMAPTNYKRPTALVSQRMVDDARAAVEALGLTSALERRYARLTDVSVNDVIWADRSARAAMRDGGAWADLATTKPRARAAEGAMAIPVGTFLSEVLPSAQRLELLLENKHAPHLVSLLAPEHWESKPLFKWNNNFSWAYAGDAADSVRERVKRAGGNVTGDLCCRLAWYNYDDLDLHLQEPSGQLIYFGNKRSLAGGELDVDMNAGGPRSREPVENIFYPDRRRMLEGIYVLSVNQFHPRETVNPGFEVEVDYLGTVTRFAYEKRLPHGQTVQVAKFRYTHAAGLELLESLPASTASRTLWGLPTQTYHRVAAALYSPNHWEGAGGAGHRHYLFLLAGCVADQPARGFFNEFLRSELDPHRKVLELVGARTKVREVDDQLSGVGFSATQPAELSVRVDGRPYRVVI